jgi:hypothetical protein
MLMSFLRGSGLPQTSAVSAPATPQRPRPPRREARDIPTAFRPAGQESGPALPGHPSRRPRARLSGQCRKILRGRTPSRLYDICPHDGHGQGFPANVVKSDEAGPPPGFTTIAFPPATAEALRTMSPPGSGRSLFSTTSGLPPPTGMKRSARLRKRCQRPVPLRHLPSQRPQGRPGAIGDTPMGRSGDHGESNRRKVE